MSRRSPSSAGSRRPSTSPARSGASSASALGRTARPTGTARAAECGSVAGLALGPVQRRAGLASRRTGGSDVLAGGFQGFAGAVQLVLKLGDLLGELFGALGQFALVRRGVRERRPRLLQCRRGPSHFAGLPPPLGRALLRRGRRLLRRRGLPRVLAAADQGEFGCTGGQEAEPRPVLGPLQPAQPPGGLGI